ncbi:carboxylesterase family protein [Variovorax sp. J22R133]|uniref:carboxylesterase/lipase family protein n=1 Tax=Variovorax brevis TaxID=3053503 RepID=UPI0025750889|nr:carboxylesterase family protein [Variovorax sp. J22R133]MDM0116138.1 carboxylesterase family protein [Variovorax sp. J22R133]
MHIDVRPAASTRRRFLLSGAAFGAAPLVGCGGGGGTPVATTAAGSFQGQSEDGVATWLGISYAQPPVGPLRFQAPRPVQPASGVVEASAFGAASLQTIVGTVSWIYPPQDVQSENCLTLNIWSPHGAQGLPVIVWLHGGGFRTGATRMPLMNGKSLAQRGVVVVTVNYRLGALGLLSHPDFADSQNGTSANWQMQDMGAALQWVRANIAAFGGDPGHVCVVGQSGGAMHTIMLAQNPAYRPLFQKAVLLSPPNVSPPASLTASDAAAYTELLAKTLGTTPLGLRDVPAQTLHAAELAQSASALPANFTSGRSPYKLAPVIDGATYLDDWTRRDWPTDLPVVIDYTLDEGSFWWDIYDPATNTMLTPAPPPTLPAVRAALTAQLGGRADAANAVIDAYTTAAIAEGRTTDPASLWIDIFGDQLLRNFGTRYAARLAAAGVPVRYSTYMHAVQAPGRGVPHCADVPMLFGTYSLDYYRAKVGAGREEARLADQFAGAIVSFARDAQPILASGAAWPVYQPGSNTSVRWGENGTGDAVIGAVPKLDQLAVWDSVLGY